MREFFRTENFGLLGKRVLMFDFEDVTECTDEAERKRYLKSTERDIYE